MSKKNTHSIHSGVSSSAERSRRSPTSFDHQRGSRVMRGRSRERLLAANMFPPSARCAGQVLCRRKSSYGLQPFLLAKSSLTLRAADSPCRSDFPAWTQPDRLPARDILESGRRLTFTVSPRHRSCSHCIVSSSDLLCRCTLTSPSICDIHNNICAGPHVFKGLYGYYIRHPVTDYPLWFTV
jgi:hypothetical protein